MMRYSMPSNGGATAPIRIVGSQRDTNIELVVDELVRTASNRGCGPLLPRARRHEGALTDDLRSPNSQTLLEERVAALGMHEDGKRINHFEFLEPNKRLKRLGHSAVSRSQQVVRTKTKGDIFGRQRRSVMESHSLAQEQPQ
ncbi:hypothetical protein ACVWZK_008359 [Bradyrhizobium sp. GM0.4]